MKHVFAALFLLVAYSHFTFAQELTQTISGKVIDNDTEEALPFVNVLVKYSDKTLGSTSDLDGYFSVPNVPVGRVTIEVSYIGYETLIVPEVMVTSAKEVTVNLKLKPSFYALDEIVIKASPSKQQPINNASIVSARQLSMEEASRYAGGFDDPARLASAFAGVASSNGGSNAIVVRGNSPKFLQWKIEGVEIPNPNHFANLSSFGGGGLTAISSNLLDNSDFMTGAFPAEYNNVLAGVFDIRLRTGNVNQHEHSFEIGLIGIDLASEGPIFKNTETSYLVNYRYSTLALIPSLLPEDADGTRYQDLSFKLNFPTQKLGTFSLWGIGLLDESGTSPETDLSEREHYQDIEEQEVKQYMGSLGLNHRYFFKNEAYLNTTLAFSTDGIDLTTDRLNVNNALIPENQIRSENYSLVFKSIYNKKFSPRFLNRTGVTLRGLGYALDVKESTQDTPLQSIVKENGFTSLLAAYTHFSLIGNNIKFNLGLTAQLFTLNQKYSIEPRLGITYLLNEVHSLSFGYGLHSRLEPLQIYFANTIDAPTPSFNQNLGFTKAHHFVLSYDWDITAQLHLKIEPYYQYLFDVPIALNSNESLLNLQADWFITEGYINSGEGRNYGVDITLEQYMNRGFYYLISGSLFNSEYKTADSEWFNTRFNKNFVFNALTGKEFNIGRSKQNILGLNIRLSVQGGDRFSRIDETASILESDVVYDETIPFSEQTRTSTVLHFTASYELNKKGSSHKFALKILNATNYEEFQGHIYNFRNQSVEESREALMLPNLSYKLSF